MENIPSSTVEDDDEKKDQDPSAKSKRRDDSETGVGRRIAVMLGLQQEKEAKSKDRPGLSMWLGEATVQATGGGSEKPKKVEQDAAPQAEASVTETAANEAPVTQTESAKAWANRPHEVADSDAKVFAGEGVIDLREGRDTRTVAEREQLLARLGTEAGLKAGPDAESAPSSTAAAEAKPEPATQPEQATTPTAEAGQPDNSPEAADPQTQSERQPAMNNESEPAQPEPAMTAGGGGEKPPVDPPESARGAFDSAPDPGRRSRRTVRPAATQADSYATGK